MTDDSKNGLVGEPAELFDLDLLGMLRQTIPLGRWDATDAGGLALGKVPALQGWQSGAPPGFDPHAHLLAGMNVGVLLRDGDCVLDEDPRNFPEPCPRGYAPATQLLDECGMDPSACPVVETGGGGLHYYIRIPPGTSIVSSLRGLRGLDVKGPRSQVVAAGSRHYGTGLLYRWRSPTPNDRPMASDALTARLMRATALSSPSSPSYADLTPEELERMLKVLKAADYRTNDQWFPLMAASHHATGGAGLDVFMDFCRSDPGYRVIEHEIEKRWRSLGDKPNAITKRTLYKEVRKAGRADLIPGEAAADFEDDPVTDAEVAALATTPKAATTTSGQMGDGTQLQPWLDEYNHRFAVVRTGADIRVLVRPREGEEVAFLKETAFHKLNHADRCEVTRSGKGKEETAVEPVSKSWMTWDGRKTFPKGLTFDPSGGPEVDGRFNLWSGWAISPRAGDWSLLRRHIYENICRGDAMHFAWTVCWFADLVQRPAKKPGSALVLQGKEGTGKSILAKQFRKLAPRNSYSLAKLDQVLGRFNMHLATSVLTVCEETFFAGDKRQSGTLRDLVTSETQQIEPKGVDSFESPNHQRIIVISNGDWVVDASSHARRFMVLKVGDKRRNDARYFAAIEEQMDGGGLAAMMHDLMALEVPQWVNLRQPPQTRWLIEQKVQSLQSLQEWWRTKLIEESMVNDIWPEQLACEVVYADYLGHAKARGDRHPRSPETLGKLMSAMGVERRQMYLDDQGVTRRPYAYFFPHVYELRLTFERHYQLTLGDGEDGSAPAEQLEEWAAFGMGGGTPGAT